MFRVQVVLGSVVAALVAVVPTIVWASDYQGFARDQGVMLGDGEAWFNDKGKLFAINDMD